MDRLMVVSNMYPSPTQPYFGVFVERQVRALRALGVDVGLAVSADRGGSPVAAAQKYGRLAAAVRREAFRTRPQAIVAHYVFPSGALALAARRRTGVPVAVVAHGGDVDPTAGKPAWVRRATRAVLTRADLTVAVSRAVAADVRAAGADPATIVVASMGYDADAFVPRSRPEARLRLGLAAGRPIVVMVGNLIPRKGVGVVIEAAARLRERSPDLQWILVGGGDPAPWLARARGAGVEGIVRFAGPADPTEVPWWLAAADIAVVASVREPYGVAAVEALACGIPVVASDTGGLAEIMDGGHGLTVTPGDAAALAAAVERILGDEPLREALGSGGPLAAEGHTAMRQAQRLLDAIESVRAS